MLTEANSCRAALINSLIFLYSINYKGAVMYQSLISTDRFQKPFEKLILWSEGPVLYPCERVHQVNSCV